MARLSDKQATLVHALLDAYRAGAFPMADPDSGDVQFFTAPRRGVLPLTPGGFHAPASLSRVVRSGRFRLTSDRDFEGVMRGCAEPRRDEVKTWISERIVRWYGLLHRAGHAHSIEAWARDAATGDDRLAGGIYGVTLGGAFFGESMFCRPRPRRPDGSRDPLDGTDASKLCLLALVTHLRRRGYTLFDTQLTNDHIARFGVVEVEHDAYMRMLEAAAARPAEWGAFEPPTPPVAQASRL